MFRLIKKIYIQCTFVCSFPFSLIAMEIQEEPAQRETSSRAANITRYDAEIFSTLKAICESRTSYNDVLSTACTRLVEMKKKGSRFSKSSINSVTEKIRRMGGDYALDHYSAFAGSADNDATDYTLLLSYISDIEHFQDNPVKFQNAVEYLEARLRMHLKKTLLGDDIEELMPVECRESYFISLCLSIMQPYHSDKAYSISTLLSPTRAAERINWGINITEINRRKDESSHLFKLIRRAILNVSSQCNFKVGDTIKKLDESIMTLEGHYRIFNNSIIDITKAKTWMLDRKGEFSEFYDAIAEGTSNFYNSSDLKSLQKIYGAFIDASKIEQSDLTTTPYWAQLEQIHTAINDAIEERSNERRLIYDVYASRGHICFDATDPRNETLKMQASTIEDEVKASKKNHHASNKKAKAKKLKERRRNNKAALKSATSAISEETPDSLSPLNILFSTAQDTESDHESNYSDVDDAESTLAASSIATETPEFIRRPAERKPARAAGATEQRRILPYSPTRISSILDRQDYGLLQTLEALESELMSIGWSARYFITQQSGNDLSYALIYARPGGLPGSLTGFRSNYKENLKLAFEGLFSAK